MLITIKFERVYLAVLTDFEVKLNIAGLNQNRDQGSMVSDENDPTMYCGWILDSGEGSHEIERQFQSSPVNFVLFVVFIVEMLVVLIVEMLVFFIVQYEA
jgi:hypothetical protein